MNQSQADELIQLLKKHELCIGALYETFATILPESKDHWLAFAKEERQHAQWIETLHTHLKKGNISLEQIKITSQSTKLAIDYAEKLGQQVIRDKPDLQQVIAYAINLEKSLLESSFFKVFKLDEPNASNIRDRLQQATRDHVARMTAWREEVRNKEEANR